MNEPYNIWARGLFLKSPGSFSGLESYFVFAVFLPAYRRLLFPLLQAEKGRLRNAVANCVPASRWVPKILGTCCDRLTHSAHCFSLRSKPPFCFALKLDLCRNRSLSDACCLFERPKR